MKNVAVGIILSDGLVLACQRKRSVRYPLKWEFPGGKIEPGESPRSALIRELKEELEIDADPGALLLTQEWVYPESASPPGSADGAFRVNYFIVRSFTGEMVNRTFEQIRWVRVDELPEMDVLEGNRPAIALLRGGKLADGASF
jgi:8-oxo-dGTP diphosphatase